MAVCAGTILLAASLCTAASGAELAVCAGKIVTMEGKVIDNGVVLVRGKKIVRVGTRSAVKMPPGATVIEAGSRWVMPGIVEAHTHVAAEGGLNDMVYPLNPDLRIGDSVDLESEAMKRALAEGITTINTMPGSGTNHSGFSVIVKTGGGTTRKERIVRDPGCLKVAQAYNPERSTGDMGGTRMGMAYLLRRLLREGKAYSDAWREWREGKRSEKPAVKPELEAVRLVFEGKIPVINHTYSGWGVAEAIRLFHDEFGLNLIITHTAFGGFQAGDFAAKRATRVHVNIGPRLVEWRYPGDGKLHNMASEYYERGVRNLSINTDAVRYAFMRLSPQEHLFFQAAMAAHYGLKEEAALRAITIEPARALMIDDRLGSLKAGKDADMVIKYRSLLDVTTPVDMVIVNGRIAYRRPGADIVVRPPSGKEKKRGRGKEQGTPSAPLHKGQSPREVL